MVVTLALNVVNLSMAHNDHLNAFKVNICRSLNRLQADFSVQFTSKLFPSNCANQKSKLLCHIDFFGRINAVDCHKWKRRRCHYILCCTSLPLSAVFHQNVYVSWCHLCAFGFVDAGVRFALCGPAIMDGVMTPM